MVLVVGVVEVVALMMIALALVVPMVAASMVIMTVTKVVMVGILVTTRW